MRSLDATLMDIKVSNFYNVYVNTPHPGTVLSSVRDNGGFLYQTRVLGLFASAFETAVCDIIERHVRASSVSYSRVLIYDSP